MIPFEYDDGGRAEAGFRGDAGDCVTRAIAIAAGRPYRETYDALFRLSQMLDPAPAGARHDHSPRTGVHRPIYDAYLGLLGWEWTPTMRIGSGCTVHLSAEELPSGRLIVRLSKHLAAVVDGVLRDNHDCSREGTRCVYGYWRPGP